MATINKSDLLNPDSRLVSARPEQAEQRSRRTSLIMATALALTAVGTGLAFLLVRSQENAAFEAQFHLDGAQRVQALHRELELNLELMRSLVALYAASENVKREEFERFLQAVNGGQPWIQSWEWAPLVARADRVRFEQANRDARVPDFQLTQQDSMGNIVRAGDRAEYCPVTYLVPFQSNQRAYGFDLLSQPDRRQTLWAARDAGETRASPKVTLEQQGESGFLLVAPIYRTNPVPPTIELRRAALAGFGLGVFRIRSIVEHALQSLDRNGLNFALFDATEKATPGLLHFHSATARPGNPPAETAAESPGRQHRDTLDVAGRSWLILCTPSPDYRAAYARWQSWSTLGGGAALTAFLTLSFLQDRRYSESLKGRVTRCTRELARAYRELEDEIRVRKRMEEALQTGQQRYDLIINGINDGIWDWNLVTNQVYFSPHWKSMLGYAEDEVKNTYQAWQELVHPDDAERSTLTTQAFLEGHCPVYELEHRLRHRDGTYRWILARGVVLRDEHGQPVRLAGTHVDLTERKRTEEQLRQANSTLADRQRQLTIALADLEQTHAQLQSTQLQLIQAEKLESIGKLAAGVAHEVKNPLQTMLMGLTYLESKISSAGTDVQLTCSDMREAISRADTIVRGLLQMSGTPNLEMGLEDVNVVLEKALGLVNYSFNAARISVVRRFDSGLPRVWMDQGKMEQVFINLLTNAIHALPQGGTIFVNTWAGHASVQPGGAPQAESELIRRVIVQIQDTGSGIPPQHLDQLFTPFFTTKQKGLGTGLGLSVTKAIVELHGGHIELINAPGGGACATVTLPTT